MYAVTCMCNPFLWLLITWAIILEKATIYIINYGQCKHNPALLIQLITLCYQFSMRYIQNNKYLKTRYVIVQNTWHNEECKTINLNIQFKHSKIKKCKSKAIPSGNLVSGPGWVQNWMQARGFGYYTIINQLAIKKISTWNLTS